MVHDATYKIKSIDAQLATGHKPTYQYLLDEDEVSVDELLDQRLELMRERDAEALEAALI